MARHRRSALGLGQRHGPDIGDEDGGESKQDLLDVALLEGLHFDQTSLTGTVFHMLSAMPTHGFVGVTCIEDSAEAAEDLYQKVIGFLTEQARLYQPKA